MTAAVLACVTRLVALGFRNGSASLATAIDRGKRDEIVEHLACMVRCYRAASVCGALGWQRRQDAAEAARACWDALDAVRVGHVVKAKEAA